MEFSNLVYLFNRLLKEIPSRNLYEICNKIANLTKVDDLLRTSKAFYENLRGNKLNISDVKKPKDYAFLKELETLIKPKYVAVILVGVPGSGKTTLGKKLEEIFKGIYLDQDMFNSKADRYHSSIDKKILEGKSLLILGKSHHTFHTRDKVCKILPDKYCKVFIEFFHPEGKEEYKKLCLKRVQERKHHQSLKNDNPKLKKIIDKFVKSFQPVSKKESLMGYTIRLDVTKTVDDWVEKIKKTKMLKDVSNSPKIEFPNKDKKKALYYAIRINDIKPIFETEEIRNCLHNNIKLQKEFHLTIKYFGKKGGSASESFYKALIGQKKEVICIGLFSDDKGICVLCDGDFPCSNNFAHITLGNKEGIRPFYSNQLCEKEKLIKFKTPIKLQGVIKGVF